MGVTIAAMVSESPCCAELSAASVKRYGRENQDNGGQAIKRTRALRWDVTLRAEV
jgi:hypothetical protein